MVLSEGGTTLLGFRMFNFTVRQHPNNQVYNENTSFLIRCIICPGDDPSVRTTLLGSRPSTDLCVRSTRESKNRFLSDNKKEIITRRFS